MGAYNKVVEREAREEAEKASVKGITRDMLPEGFVPTGSDDPESQWGLEKLKSMMWYMLTSNPRGSESIAGRHAFQGGPGAGVLLVWALERVAAKFPKDDPATLTYEQLKATLGERAANGLLIGYGAAHDPQRANARHKRRSSSAESEGDDDDDELDHLVAMASGTTGGTEVDGSGVGDKSLPKASSLPAPCLTPQTSSASDPGKAALTIVVEPGKSALKA